MKKYIKLESIVFILFAIVTLVLVFRHEAWKDEAQSWLIVKNLNFFDVFKQLKYEGHPFLYYVVIMPLAKFGFSYRSINILSWVFGCLSVLIILYKLSLNWLLKIVIIFSYPVCYCTVIGRSYSLVMFFMIFLCYIYGIREKRPLLYGILLFMLVNTHILCFGFVLSLMLVDIYYLLKGKIDKRIIWAFVISFIGVFLLCLQVIPSLNSLDSNSLAQLKFSFMDSIRLMLLFLPNFACFVTYDGGYILPILFLFSFGKFVSFLDKRSFFVFIISVMFFFFVHCFVYQLTDYHFLVLLFICLFCYFSFKRNEMNDLVLNLKTERISKYLFIMFLCTVSLSFYMGHLDFKYNYSNSHDVANYINKNINNNSVFLCTDDASCSSLVPYLSNDYQFVSFYSEKKFTFITWSEERKINREFNDLIWLVLSGKYNYVIHVYGYGDSIIKQLVEEEKLVSLYRTLESIRGENYEILKIDEKKKCS